MLSDTKKVTTSDLVGEPANMKEDQEQEKQEEQKI